MGFFSFPRCAKDFRPELIRRLKYFAPLQIKDAAEGGDGGGDGGAGGAAAVAAAGPAAKKPRMMEEVRM